MIQTATKIYLLSSLFALSHPTEFSLPIGQSSTRIGLIHVFADEAQTISLLVPGDESIMAQLYRCAGTSVNPAGQPITVPFSGHTPTSVRIDFPHSEKRTRYILVFFSKTRPWLDITVLPLNHLDRLRKIAWIKPIILVHPPEGLADSFRRLGVPIVISDQPIADKEGMLIVFPNAQIVFGSIKARRVIILDSSTLPGREIWVSKAPDRWHITVHPRHFTSEVLLTADGQAKLIELLLGSPETI